MAEIPRGRPCWFELLTSDPDAAQAFYPKVAPWTTQAWEGGETPYSMWMNGEAPVGGVMQVPDEAAAAGAPSHWLMYVSTPNTDETIARVRELGGTVMWGPMDIPMVGRLAGLVDPQGAGFAIIQPASEAPGHDGEFGVGEVSWHELATDDWEAAWAFYSDVFDWVEHDSMDMGPGGTYYMFSRGAHPLGGMFNRPAEMPVSAWLLYVSVPDVDTAAERVKELGGRILNGPMEVPGGDRIVQCLDPQGAAFALHSKAG